MNISQTMPHVIRETSDGTTARRLQDELFQRREIDCVGEIDPETAYSLILQLRHLQHTAPQEEITMYINSPGGHVVSGMALYDVMTALTCPIRTVCVGQASSMAAVLFVCGNRRDILPHARVMIHDPRVGDVGGSALTLDAISKDLMKTREATAAIIARHSGRSLEAVLEKTAKDSYFDAGEAVAFGLADRVIDKI